ncbi:MAG TPA: hypothetical protein EYH48_00190 [Aquifex aeolicus]|uniref:Hemerythrin-like domain-containing protein n=1 Tax=Aquifex aeolicus TaxID=63363 RepID=A0A9D1CFG8_AQUAO|nr:hypothetical protein [Aquificales bacterium]HIP98875.1 hypothetical protein [Aquifex aeolicus]HIQ25743.1 hypothetical protein [Aquifex aeolicus]
MADKETLLKQHQILANQNPLSEGFVEKLRKHFEQEEAFLEKHKEILGGSDELSPLQMVKKEHRLLLEYLEKGEIESFKNLFKYHTFKEETQIYTLLE